MIISTLHRYVYIGIPRTGSKSMNRWLIDHFAGEWVGYHHSWRVPAEYADFLVFTLVRNPYARAFSGWFAVPWSNPAVQIKPVAEFAAEMRQNVIPYRNGVRLIPEHNVPEVGMNQAHFAAKAGVRLALAHEALPDCLAALPFVDPAHLPPFPHVEEAGQRPTGDFFDHFTAEDEAMVWEYAAEDFAAFGYRRFDPGPPAMPVRWLDRSHLP